MVVDLSGAITGSVAEFISYAEVVIIIMLVWYVIKFFLVPPPSNEDKKEKAKEWADRQGKVNDWLRGKIQENKDKKAQAAQDAETKKKKSARERHIGIAKQMLEAAQERAHHIMDHDMRARTAANARFAHGDVQQIHRLLRRAKRQISISLLHAEADHKTFFQGIYTEIEHIINFFQEHIEQHPPDHHASDDDWREAVTHLNHNLRQVSTNIDVLITHINHFIENAATEVGRVDLQRRARQQAHHQQQAEEAAQHAVEDQLQEEFQQEE